MTVKRLLAMRSRHQNYISPDAWIAKAIRRLNSDDVGALVVSEDGEEIEGIISERDIIRGLNKYGSRVLKFTVLRLMSEEVVTCQMSDTALSIMQKMDKHKIRHIPIVDEKDRFEGIISIRDVLRDRLEDMENESIEMRNYITGKIS